MTGDEIGDVRAELEVGGVCVEQRVELRATSVPGDTQGESVDELSVTRGNAEELRDDAERKPVREVHRVHDVLSPKRVEELRGLLDRGSHRFDPPWREGPTRDRSEPHVLGAVRARDGARLESGDLVEDDPVRGREALPERDRPAAVARGMVAVALAVSDHTTYVRVPGDEHHRPVLVNGRHGAEIAVEREGVGHGIGPRGEQRVEPVSERRRLDNRHAATVGPRRSSLRSWEGDAATTATVTVESRDPPTAGITA